MSRTIGQRSRSGKLERLQQGRHVINYDLPVAASRYHAVKAKSGDTAATKLLLVRAFGRVAAHAAAAADEPAELYTGSARTMPTACVRCR